MSKMIENLLRLMADYGEKENEPHSKELIENYGQIAEKIIKYFGFEIEPKPESVTQSKKDQQNFFQKPIEYRWNAKGVGSFFRVAIMANKIELVWQEFEKFVKKHNKIPGELE